MLSQKTMNKAVSEKIYLGNQNHIFCIHREGLGLRLEKLSPNQNLPDEHYHVSSPYLLASREWLNQTSEISITDQCVIGGHQVQVMAGPCSVESRTQIIDAAREVWEAGATILRGGAYKPRTSPYAFQGLEEKGLAYLKEAGEMFGMPVITEIMDSDTLDMLCDYTDILQIGTRNCQNFSLLKKVGKINKPVMLKRGMSTTIEEWLLAAEYILSGGNMNVILCERGIRSFEKDTRNTLDLSAVVSLKEKTHLPVVVDPSHATGKASYVEPLVMAAIACGADGVMIETHPYPEKALCDGAQALDQNALAKIIGKMRTYAELSNRSVANPGSPAVVANHGDY